MCQTIGHYCRTPASMLTTLRLTSATILYYYIFTLNKYRLALFKARWDLHQKKQVGLDRPWKIAIGSVLIPDRIYGCPLLIFHRVEIWVQCNDNPIWDQWHRIR